MNTLPSSILGRWTKRLWLEVKIWSELAYLAVRIAFYRPKITPAKPASSETAPQRTIAEATSLVAKR